MKYLPPQEVSAPDYYLFEGFDGWPNDNFLSERIIDESSLELKFLNCTLLYPKKKSEIIYLKSDKGTSTTVPYTVSLKRFCYKVRGFREKN